MCNCIPQDTEIKGVRLAMAYVPWQKFCTTFSPIEALKRGTAFSELYSPYEGKEKDNDDIKTFSLKALEIQYVYKLIN